MTSSRTVARNTLLNLAGQVVPSIAALVGIPILIHHLGTARFGVLSLAWAAVGYFGLFDLGLSRALTQAVAVLLGERETKSGGEDDLRTVAWTALALMLVLGVVGGVVLAAASPWLVSSGLTVPPELRAETLRSFYLLAMAMPFVVASAGLRGLLEAHQHFGVVAALRVPLSLFTFVAPLAVLPFSSSLTPVVAVLVTGRVLTTLAFLAVCVRRYDYMRAPSVSRAAMLPLVRFGSWMTVSNVVSPLMSYVDRFFVGAILPVAAVAWYVTPLEVVSRLIVLPLALVSALFPAFAATYVVDRRRTAQLFEQSLRLLLLALFPLFLILALFAREGLTLWVGPEMASHSATVLRWLAVGSFLNCLGQSPFAVLQGCGRPDLTAKTHMTEVPLYAAALWILAHRYGVVGVAMAWTFRVSLDTALLLILARRQLRGTDVGARRVLVTLAVTLSALVLAATLDGLALKISFLGLMLLGVITLGWTRGLTPAERHGLREWISARRARGALFAWTPQQRA